MTTTTWNHRTEPELPVSEIFDRIRDARRLLVLAPSQVAARDLLGYLAQLLEEEDEPLRVSRGNGVEAIQHDDSGGRLAFGTITTAVHRLRGQVLDAVYLYGVRLEDEPEPDRLSRALTLSLVDDEVNELVEC